MGSGFIIFMRTAHEWYLKINSYSNPNQMNDVERNWVEKMINEARKEAIEECADLFSKDSEKRVYILKLINELK